MKLGIKLNLQTFRTATLTEDFSINFTDISNLQDWNDSITVSAEVVNELEMYYHDGEKYLGVDTTNPVQQPEDEFYDDDVSRPSLNGYIKFNCIVSDSDLSTLLKLINLAIVELDQFGKTNMIVYRLNDERNKLSKTLTPVTILEGSFKAPLGIKTLEIDVIDYDINNSYNYVYIPRLNRYYYVTNIQLTTKDYTKLLLQEDVLMSWSDLIKIQTAFITRNENTADNVIVDNRLPLESVKTVEYIYPLVTLLDSKVNIQLKGNFTTEFNILVSCYNDVFYTKSNVLKVDDNLPDLSPIQSGCQTSYFLTFDLFDSFTKAILDEETMASALNSAIFLPFDPTTAFNTGITAQTLAIGLPDSKVLCSDDKFHYLYDIPSGVTTRQVRRTAYGTSPYLVLADFTFPSLNDDWYNHEPFTIYELYIAFVGWIKVDSAQLSNKRILIYYTLDYQTGNATAYVYNKTDGKLIYSCGCQLGVKLDIITSNSLELSRERQATQLNTLIGLLASAVSIGAGVVSENPVAIAGGVLSAGKTIASAVNSERMRFERAQISFGSGDAGLHSNLTTMIRKTYNKQILSGYGLSYYYHMQGKPCNTYGNIGSFEGYTEIAELHFNPYGNNIYQTEIDEIVALLKNGVIL